MSLFPSSLLSESSSFRDFLNPLIPLPSEDPRSPSLLGPKIMSRIASIRINSHMPNCPNILRGMIPEYCRFSNIFRMIL